MPDVRYGRYRVERTIGAGTFATVYKARDDALDVPVAVKVLAQNWSFDPEVRSRFVNEAQILRRADGARVVRVHDIGESEDGQPFFVMDYADRGTVEDRAQELAIAARALAVEDVARFARQLAAGVGAVHRLNVVHRDLKPSNLLLVSDPRLAAAPDAVGTALVRADERLVVSDLGLARELMGPTRLTAAVGTPGYMAPEQLVPNANLDQRADIYAATAILHTLLTGRPPQSDSVASERLPAPVQELLQRGLAADPSRRFTTAAEWLDAVERSLDVAGAEWGVTPVSPFAHALSGLARSTPPSGPVPAVSLIDASQAARESKRGRGMRGAIAGGVAALLAIGGFVVLRDRNSETVGPGTASSSTTAGVSGPLATTQRLFEPLDLALGTNGEVYVSESSGNRVQVLRGDRLVAFAGTGAPDFGGDGGEASDASFYIPVGITAAGDGSVYVADRFNERVRRIDADGVITSVAGNGESSGQSVAAGEDPRTQIVRAIDVTTDAEGTLYVAEATPARVWRLVDGKVEMVAGASDPNAVPKPIVDGQSATDVVLGSPQSIALDDSGRLLISDAGRAQILRVDPDGTIEVVAGTGKEGFSGDGGGATKAQLRSPDGVVADGDAVVFSDSGNSRVRQVDADGIITTIAGTDNARTDGDGGPAADASFASPAGIVVADDGTLYVADSTENRVRAIAADGTITTVIGAGPAGLAGDGGPAIEAPLRDPVGVAFDADGRLLIGENFSGWIRRVNADETIETIAGLDGSLPGSWGLAANERGLIATAQIYDSTVRAVLPDGTIDVIAGDTTEGFDGDGGRAARATMQLPVGLAFAPSRGIAIADSGNNRVRFVGSDGVINTIAGNGKVGAAGDDVPLDGSPVVATNTPLIAPYGLTYSDDGTLFVTSSIAHTVYALAPNGELRRYGGDGQQGSRGDGGPALEAGFDQPTGIAVDADGAVYVAEQGAHVVRRIDTDGTITTVAGTGLPGFSGDGGAATEAQLDGPSHLTVGPDGALYIADTGNNRMRRVDLDTGTITTIAGAF